MDYYSALSCFKDKALYKYCMLLYYYYMEIVLQSKASEFWRNVISYYTYSDLARSNLKHILILNYLINDSS